MAVRTHLGLVAVLALSALVAAGCSGGGDDRTSAGAGGDGDEMSTEAVNESVPGVTEESIKLGTSLPITGPAALAGEGAVAGIHIAIDEVNAAGGIDGRRVELVALDDAFDPPRLVANARRLLEEEKVYALASPVGSQALPGIWDLVAEAGTIVWGPLTPKDPQIQQVYILGPSRGEQMRICTDYMAEKGLTKVALIGQDNELGEEGNDGMEAAAEANGLEYVAFERVEVLSHDIASAVQNVLNAGAEGIMLSTDGAQAALIMQETDKLDANVLLCADNGGGGTGSSVTVGPAGAAADGFHGALQVALPTDDRNEGVSHWNALADAYAGLGKDQAKVAYSLQTYYYTRALFDVIDRLEGDLRYESFHAVAEGLAEKPLDYGALPIMTCGPLPDGHDCADGAALARYSVDGETWQLVRDFEQPNQ